MTENRQDAREAGNALECGSPTSVSQRIRKRRIGRIGKQPQERVTTPPREPGQPWDRNAYARAYNALKSRTDPVYRVLKSLQSRTNAVLQGVEHEPFRKLLACDNSKLTRHLAKQFTVGMTWENYGKWHVDHKRPCLSFDLTDPAQQAECFHFSNLQPLWAKDNLLKSARHCPVCMQREAEERRRQKEALPRLGTIKGSWHDRIRFAYNYQQSAVTNRSDSALTSDK